VSLFPPTLSLHSPVSLILPHFLVFLLFAAFFASLSTPLPSLPATHFHSLPLPLALFPTLARASLRYSFSPLPLLSRSSFTLPPFSRPTLPWLPTYLPTTTHLSLFSTARFHPVLPSPTPRHPAVPSPPPARSWLTDQNPTTHPLFALPFTISTNKTKQPRINKLPSRPGSSGNAIRIKSINYSPGQNKNKNKKQKN
jgi:hypothetical protein